MKNKRDLALFAVFVMLVGGIFLANPQIFGDAPSTAYSAYPGPGDGGNVGKQQPALPSPTPTSKPIEQPISSPEAPTIVAVEFDVTFEGVDDKMLAELQLVPFADVTKQLVTNLGINLPDLKITGSIEDKINASLPVGVYKLIIDAPSEYFREPAGYLFLVAEDGIVRNTTTQFHFQLIPPSDQSLPPCRNVNLPPRTDSETEIIKGDLENRPNIICKAEMLADASSPSKSSEPKEVMTHLSTGYHYIGPRTYQDNKGVWGRNTVVDAGVNHTGNLGHFVVERVYANDSSLQMTALIPGGWKQGGPNGHCFWMTSN